jgi:Resolvase, N terminal domain
MQQTQTQTVGIPCVIYAAKSTEDHRGSIPAQLQELREMIQGDERRRLIAEYSDEAFSAYRRDRGPGLVDATQHAEDLSAEHGICELWAQHSDRIARGDGRRARHTVEVALWALKHDVRVRTIQDPDIFRDLLYAVVTGQRNNEDSRRKGLATQAGRKRAIARGEYIGHLRTATGWG